MNLNRLFRQFKIRKKMTIAFTLLATVPLSLTGFFGIHYTIRLLEENSLQQLRSSLSTMQLKLDRFLNEAKDDIFYLRDSFVFRQFATALAGDNRRKLNERKQVVQKEFLDFVQKRGIYYQVRFLDRFANEILRIEHDGDQTVIIPEELLAKRQDVFYLNFAESGANQELLYPPAERQSHKVPGDIVPAISYFLPVYADNNSNSLQGVLITNVYARKLFEILKEEPARPGRRTLLADNAGHYLFDSERSEWNKLLALRKQGNVTRDFPKDLRDRLLSGNEGLIDGDRDEIIAYAPIYFTGTADNFMVLFECISKSLIREPIFAFMKLVFIFGSVTFAVALLLGFVAANQFTKPIETLSKRSEMLAQGNLEHPVIINTNDEIEQLANDFNRMADDIHTHEQQLKQYAGNLENKVSERTRELSKTLSYLRNLIDSSVDAIITLKNDRTIEFFSKGAEAILGFQSSEMIGKEICSFCQSCVLEQCPILGVAEQRTKSPSYQISFLTKQGKPVPLNMSASPIKNENGKLAGILTISKDMTEHGEMQRQIQQAEKLAGIGELAAGLAHQLNTPLASIILSAQMSREIASHQEVLEDLDKIERQADHCKKLIQNLLSFARPPDQNKSRICVEDVIDIVVRILEKELAQKDIRIETDFDGRPHEIKGNENQIEQLFFNLLNNAEDAMPEGGEIRIKTHDGEDDEVWISVTDTGVGIAPDALNKIFDPFFSTKEVGKGTGLGLSVCYGIVEDHNGAIDVQSHPGEGAAFSLKFPGFTSREIV